MPWDHRLFYSVKNLRPGRDKSHTMPCCRKRQNILRAWYIFTKKADAIKARARTTIQIGLKPCGEAAKAMVGESDLRFGRRVRLTIAKSRDTAADIYTLYCEEAVSKLRIHSGVSCVKWKVQRSGTVARLILLPSK